MAAFRLGLVGAGRMGRTHLRALAGSELLRVVAVADPVAATRDELEGPGLSVHAEIAGMLRLAALDGVLVAAPSDRHLQTISELAVAGLPVLCEKPCGVTSQQARQAAAIAASGNIPLQIAYWRRFLPSLQRLRQRISAGELGELYLVACYQWDRQPPAAAFRKQSGGIFIDMGVHEFDQIRWLSGQEIGETSTAVSTVASEPPIEGDPESAQILCRLSGGSTAFVSLGRRYPLGDVCRVEVFGSRGAQDCRSIWPPVGEPSFMAALRAQAESFVRWSGGGAAEGASAADAVAALAAAEAAARIFEQDPKGP